MEAPTAHGFLGVIMYDDKDDRVQCHICGRWYASVGAHVARGHGISGPDYKERFGLAQGVALCATSVSSTRSSIASKGVANGTFITSGMSNKLTPGRKMYFRRAGKYRTPGTSVLSTKNRHGLCELQMLMRYNVVKSIVKREPIQPDFEKYDRTLLGAIFKSFKSLNKYKKTIGAEENARGGVQLNSDIELIAHLRKWVHDNSSRPQMRDFIRAKNGYPIVSVFVRRFGSWNNALGVAGIK